MQDYMKSYHIIYNEVIEEAKRKANEKCILMTIKQGHKENASWEVFAVC